MSDRLVGVVCGVAAVALFSGFTLASRLGLSSSLTLPDLAALRFGIGGSLLMPTLARYGLRGVRPRDAAVLALLGGAGFAPLAYAGFALAPAAHGAVLLHGTVPLFTDAILRATPRPDGGGRRTLGLALIAAGIALMARDSLVHAHARQLAGDAFLLLASLSWSGYGVMSRRLGLPPAQSASIVAVLSMLAFLPIYALLPGKALFAASARQVVPQLAVQGVLVGAVSIFVYTRAVATLGPTTTSLFTSAVPCATTLAAIPLLGEKPSSLALAGVAAVTAGMIVGLASGRARGLPRAEPVGTSDPRG